MYNEDCKMKYMQELVANDKYKKGIEIITTYFNLSEMMETTLKKDIANFTLNEIIDFYKSICTTSELYLASINSQLSAYCNWNSSQGLSIDNQNHFEEVDRDILDSCIQKNLFKSQYITKEELYSFLNSGKCTNVSDEFLMLAFFEGICGIAYEEILNLYYTDIKNNIVELCTGRKLKISDKLVELARESAGTYVFHTENKDCPFDDSDRRCFKRYRKNITQSNEKFVIIRRMDKLKTLFDSNAMNSKYLMESGRLHMIKIYMKEHNCDLAACLDDDEFRNQIEMRYGRLQSRLSYVRKFKELLDSWGA